MKKCRYCNMSYNDDLFICPNCNAKLPEPKVETMEVDMDDELKKKGNRILWITIATCIVPTLCILLRQRQMFIWYIGSVFAEIFVAIIVAICMNNSFYFDKDETSRVYNDHGYYKFKVILAIVLVVINIVFCFLPFFVIGW